MAMKKRVIHLMRPEARLTPNGMVIAYCSVLDGIMNVSTIVREQATCLKCLSLETRGKKNLPEIQSLNFRNSKESGSSHGKV
jgi:hypothetical protein